MKRRRGARSRAPPDVEDPLGRGGLGDATFDALDIDFGVTHGVAHLLGTLTDVLANRDLLGDEGLLADDGLFTGRQHLDRTVAEGVVTNPDGPVHRPPLDADGFLAQRDLLADWRLNDVGTYAHAAALDFALSNHQALFSHLDDVVGRS